MNLAEYESLPDSMSRDEIHRHCMTVLEESKKEDISVTLAKLNELGDRQWHTYELPDSALQARLRRLLIDNWVAADQGYLESVLGLSYCFALDKELYRCALTNYTGDHLEEFQRSLENSVGDNINPWWSMAE